MTIKFNDVEIKLIKSLEDTVNNEQKVILSNIVTKMLNLNKTYENIVKDASKRITELRKDDKWYGRSKVVVQNHFNTVAKKIKTHLISGKSNEARKLYKVMLDEAKFPRHEAQFKNAVNEYLTDLDIEFLNRR